MHPRISRRYLRALKQAVNPVSPVTPARAGLSPLESSTLLSLRTGTDRAENQSSLSAAEEQGSDPAWERSSSFHTGSAPTWR